MMNRVIVATLVHTALGYKGTAATHTCDKFATVAASTDTKFKLPTGTTLADNDLLYYDAGTNGYKSAEFPDKTVYKVVGKTASDFKLVASLNTAGTNFAAANVQLKTWSKTEAYAMNNGKFRIVTKFNCLATTNRGVKTESETVQDPKKYFNLITTGANEVCVTDQNFVMVMGTYKGASTTAHTVTTGTSGVTLDSVYQCIFTSTTKFSLAPKANTNAKAAANKGDAAVTLSSQPMTLSDAVYTGTGSLCFWTLGTYAEKATYETAAAKIWDVCKDSAEFDNASCAAKNGKTAADKQFWVTDKCDVGSDANCLKLNKDTPKWDKANNKCVKKTTSSATRVFASASIVALFGLMA